MPTATTTPSSSPVFPSAEGDAPVPLSKAPVGWRRVVAAVDGPDRAHLEGRGVLPGSVLVVTARTPLGGPLVVELGLERLALTSAVAAQVATRPFGSRQDPAG
jgi:Fe2+ transport system protein FeoA